MENNEVEEIRDEVEETASEMFERVERMRKELIDLQYECINKCLTEEAYYEALKIGNILLANHKVDGKRNRQLSNVVAKLKRANF